MAITIKISEKEPGVYNIRLDGELNTETYKDCEDKFQEIIDKQPRVVLVNMGGVSYISSMGIGVLMKTKKTIEEARGVFIIANFQPQIQKAFEVVKSLLGQSIFVSTEEADAYLDKIQKGEIPWENQ